MEVPSVRSTIKDPKKDITYYVLAYRPLTRPELVEAVRYFSAHSKKRPKRGSAITIISIIGAND